MVIWLIREQLRSILNPRTSAQSAFSAIVNVNHTKVTADHTKVIDNYTNLTPYSGLIQLKKYALNEGLKDIHDLFTEIQELTKKVKEEIYRLLVDEFKYFD